MDLLAAPSPLDAAGFDMIQLRGDTNKQQMNAQLINCWAARCARTTKNDFVYVRGKTYTRACERALK
jgi:hypothetical protein